MSADPRNQVVSTFHLRRRTPRSFLLVPCPRQGRSIRCQGQLEGAAATILVACPMVAHIQEQPLTIWYQWREQGNTLHIELLKAAPDVRPRKEANAGCSYIVPDFLVEMASGQKRLVEVKPSDRLAKPLAQRKLSVARQHGPADGRLRHARSRVRAERRAHRTPLQAAADAQSKPPSPRYSGERAGVRGAFPRHKDSASSAAC